MGYPKKLIFFTTMLAACLLVASKGIAQTTLVTVEGVVMEEKGPPLPGASVTFREQMTGFQRSTVSREDGYYLLSGLRPGKYEAEVSLSGFQTKIRKGLTLSVGAELRINFTLAAAALEEEVTVVAESPMVEVTKAEVSAVVDRNRIDSLPLLDRNFGNLTSMKAGTALEAGTNVRSNAQPLGSEEILTDGVSNEWVGRNTVRSQIPADAIQEFRVITNQYEAEYGNASGMIRSAITRSGTNDFRGRLSFFTRLESLDTPGYFVNHDRYQGEELPKEEWEDAARFKHYNWSGFLGGPIVKDKAHFFVLYEGTKHEEYTTVTSTLVDRQTYPFQQPRTQVMAKFDYQFSDKSLLFARYTLDKPDRIDYVPGGLYTYTTGYTSKERTHEFQVNWTYYPSDNMMNEMRVFYADNWYGNHSIEDGKYDDTFFEVRPSGYFGQFVNYPQEMSEKRYQFVDNFSLFAKDHNLKFGIDASYVWLGGFVNQYFPGGYIFTTDEPFDANDFSTYPTYLRTCEDLINTDSPYWEVGIFAQDSWRVNKRLTLNYGLRYNYYNVQFLDYKTFDLRHLNPRFGFSYDPIGDGKTSIRGGIGTYSQNPQLNLGLLVGNMNQLAVLVKIYPGYPDPKVPNPFVPPTDVAIPTTTYRSDPSMIYPYTMQATIGFQREVITDFSIGIDLVYTKGYKFSRAENENRIIPGTVYLRPDMTKADDIVWRGNGRSDYRGLYVTMSKRFSHGWSLDVAYTLSRSWSDVETEQTGAFDNEEDRWEKMYGPNIFDRTHRLSVMGIVDLPASFQLSGTGYYMSAQPYSEFYAGDQNLDGKIYDLLPDNPHRNSNRKFDYFAANFRLSWYLNIERFRVQLFGEVYNATNRTNFYFFNAFTREGDTFGHPTAAFDPRRFQLGIRLDF
jgi:hypothetical protein